MQSPSRGKNAKTRIFNFLDDQGYEVNLYLTDRNERSFKVVVPKSFAAVAVLKKDLTYETKG